ncbi:hypothetical protein GGI03_004576 [Coemansia sp. RSA 2337]|nr:hypothetical protein H4S04_005029 [Coemansia sp. S16]KAJ2070940.1 hypothetical protein GGH13_003687 [Coemansia sp. S155-1]KAJ2462274.1 hypothetical protein GGI03_004576 [Coemansia sp. RSA 2337]
MSRNDDTRDSDHSQWESLDKQEEPVVVKETPLPWKQIAPLVAMRLAEPINFTLILPFMYKMIEDFGVAETPKDISYYASLLFVSLSISQTVTVMYWGRLSDRIGRRPVLIAGLIGTLAVSILFGVCKTFTMALLVRLAAGVFAGNAAVMKSAMAEIADDTNRSRMMALLPLTWNFGSMVGSGVGGVFSNPATQFPGLFGNSKLFIYFPYLLPCLIGSTVAAFGLVAGIFNFKETLVRPTQAVIEEAVSEQPVVAGCSTEATPLLSQSAATSVAPVKQSSMKSLLTPLVVRVMVTNAIMCFAYNMCDQLYPIFAATDPRDGGLGLDPRSIGVSLGVEGIVVVYIQLVVYPRLERKFGVLYCYRRGLSFAIPYLVSMPFLSIIAAHLQTQAGTSATSMLLEKVVMWVILMSLMTMRITSSVMAFTSINLMITNMAPTRADLGFMNGTQQLAMSVVRIFAPIVSGSLWSWSIKHSLPLPFNSHLVWTLSAVLIAIVLKLSYRIPDSVNKFAADQPKPIACAEELVE